VKEHNSDVRFYGRFGHAQCIGHNYRNSSVIVDWLCGRYHVPQNELLVSIILLLLSVVVLLCPGEISI